MENTNSVNGTPAGEAVTTEWDKMVQEMTEKEDISMAPGSNGTMSEENAMDRGANAEEDYMGMAAGAEAPQENEYVGGAVAETVTEISPEEYMPKDAEADKADDVAGAPESGVVADDAGAGQAMQIEMTKEEASAAENVAEM